MAKTDFLTSGKTDPPLLFSQPLASAIVFVKTNQFLVVASNADIYRTIIKIGYKWSLDNDLCANLGDYLLGL